MIQCAIHEDAVEPRAKVGTPFELFEMQIRVEQAFLNDILGILFVPSDTKGEVVHVSTMTLDERQECLQIAVVHLTGSSAACLIQEKPRRLAAALVPERERRPVGRLTKQVAGAQGLRPIRHARHLDRSFKDIDKTWTRVRASFRACAGGERQPAQTELSIHRRRKRLGNNLPLFD